MESQAFKTFNAGDRVRISRYLGSDRSIYAGLSGTVQDPEDMLGLIEVVLDEDPDPEEEGTILVFPEEIELI